MRKIRASLQYKSNHYYIVVSYYDLDGKRKQKWVKTGLEWNEDNELEAEKMRISILETYRKEIPDSKNDILFGVYYKNWLYNIKKKEVRDNTWLGYEIIWNKYINPYFSSNKFKISDMDVLKIQKFYDYLQYRMNVTPNSLRKIHANMSSCLSNSCSDMLLTSNPANYVKLPKKTKYKAITYSVEEVKSLLNVVEGTDIEIPSVLAANLGLRRSELLGLQWNDIDFMHNTITISSTIIKVGSRTVFKENSTKNDSSASILPISSNIRDFLLEKYEIKNSNWVCCYIKTGEPLKPDYLTKKFHKILIQNGLKPIRFHDLRHTCATLLLESGVEMHLVQQILRHNQITTTVDIYGESTLKGKKIAVDKMDKLLS